MADFFPDVVPLIGEQRLADMWVNNPRGSLVTIKVNTLPLAPLAPLAPPCSPCLCTTFHGIGSSDLVLRPSAFL